MLSEDEVDLSLLEGRSFTCLEHCQLCCLHPPELMPREARYFRQHHPDRIERRERPHRHLSLAMRKGIGPCIFLVDRRCEVYEHRPSFCRQYPIHLHLGERLEAEPDLSCRGVWTGEGTELLPMGREIVKGRQRELEGALAHTRGLYRTFTETCREAGIHRQVEGLRAGAASLERMADLTYLGAVLDRSADEDPMESLPIRPATIDGRSLGRLRESIGEMALDSLRSEDIAGAPTYCDRAGRWHILASDGRRIRWSVLDEGGEVQEIDVIDGGEVWPRTPGEEGRRVFGEYMRILNARDSVLGYAYYLVDAYGYEDFVSNTYYGVLGTSAADLLWRSALLGHLFPDLGDGEAIREGILFYDMDRLGAPTLGRFL